MTWATTRRWRHEVATVEIREDQAQVLEELSVRDNVPLDRIVTAARAAYFGKKSLDPRRAIAGLWADRNIDGVEYQRSLREN